MQGNSALVGYFTVAEVACGQARQGHGPVTTLDAYRCPARNEAVRGTPASQHKLGLGSRPAPASAARTPASAARRSAGSARLLAGSRAGRRRARGGGGGLAHA